LRTPRMNQANRRVTLFGMLQALALVCASASLQAAPQQPALTPSASPHRALLDKYCVTCHNQQAKTAGLMLDKMDVDHVSSAAETWEKVIRKLQGGMMPP